MSAANYWEARTAPLNLTGRFVYIQVGGPRGAAAGGGRGQDQLLWTRVQALWRKCKHWWGTGVGELCC